MKTHSKDLDLLSQDALDDDYLSANGFEYLVKEQKRSQLIVLEQELEIAENRCEELQRQVEYMKMLYDGNSEDIDKSLESSNENLNTKEEEEVFKTSKASTLAVSGRKPSKVRQLKEHYEQLLLREHESNHSSSSNDFTKKNNRKKKNGKDKGINKKKTDIKLGTKRSNENSKKKVLEADSQRSYSKGSLKKKEEDWIYSRSYLTPTVASEMKRATRHSSPSFDFRSIPFVAGKSTTKSHNLGIKIQETLSIIKMNNPLEIGKLEPTADPTGSTSLLMTN